MTMVVCLNRGFVDAARGRGKCPSYFSNSVVQLELFILLIYFVEFGRLVPLPTLKRCIFVFLNRCPILNL